MSFLRSAAVLSIVRSRSSCTSVFGRSLATRALQPRTVHTTLAYGATLIAATSLLLAGTLHAESSQEPDSPEIKADTETITDPATGIEFPKSLKVSMKGDSPTMSLVGVGVRKVSFLGIKVYSIGFYADLNNASLQLSNDLTVDEKIERVIRSCACMVRIVPTRDTSYTHLRDAFVRAAGARMLARRRTGNLSEEEVAELNSPIRRLKTLFPNTPLRKHSPLDVYLMPSTPGRPRTLLFRDLGSIESDWLSVEFMLHYFEGKPPSPPLKQAVTDTLTSPGR